CCEAFCFFLMVSSSSVLRFGWRGTPGWMDWDWDLAMGHLELLNTVATPKLIEPFSMA
ncbi:unnamed protein product, partial [Bubo scandiacus]